ALHPFSGKVLCDVCDAPLGAIGARGRPEYKCKTGHVRIDMADVDAHVLKVVLGYLARDDVYEALHAHSDSAELDVVTAELAKPRTGRAEAEHATPANRAEAKMFARLVDDLTAKVAETEMRQRELTTPSDLLDLVGAGPDVAKRWAAAPVSARRKAAARL